ncbi:MAG: 23S rRNA (uracil(1939)-C(5))-methyltransferase RlmD, partial [Agathobacter sp.]
TAGFTGADLENLLNEAAIIDYIHLRETDSTLVGNVCEFALTDTAVAYHISPQSFYQVNPVQTEKLYSTALEYAGLTGKENVWDLYCGIGTISLFLAQKAKQVYGVEIVPQAIEDAKNNAKLNGISNAEFFEGKAEEVLPEFYERLKAQGEAGVAEAREMLRPDVIVVDPPRKGCDEACLSTMLKMQPGRIVYVSCDSATLARDLRILCDGGYELKKVRAFDQFAHTMHVECAVKLQRKNS